MADKILTGGISFDASDFLARANILDKNVENKKKQAIHDIAEDILRLSQVEVPHDTGELQNSGFVEPTGPAEEATVGYNKVYAARLHEHPEYHFQKGRKGKYLEDPIKNNIASFLKYFEDIVSG